MRFVIAATGASGTIYLQRLLDQIDCTAHEVHLVMSAYARQVAAQEVDRARQDIGGPHVAGLPRAEERGDTGPGAEIQHCVARRVRQFRTRLGAILQQDLHLLLRQPVGLGGDQVIPEHARMAVDFAALDGEVGVRKTGKPINEAELRLEYFGDHASIEA